MTRVAINGFGRIGRAVFKIILDRHKNLEIVAVNDLTDTKTLAHLLQYDSTYGVYPFEVTAGDKTLKVGRQEFACLAEKDPANLPWKDLGADAVLECSGYFTDQDGASKHLEAGAKQVIISAPSKSGEVAHYVLGVNEKDFDPKKDKVVSMGSCTTNCLAPIAKVLNDRFEIESGLMTTAHSYTNDQALLDFPHKDLRRARSAGFSIIPTTTGAVIAVTKTIPELEGKIHGLAIRVPTPIVSLVDFVAKVKKKTSVEEVNDLLRQAADNELKGILAVEERSLVSIDFKGSSFSAVVDSPLTMVSGGNLVKVLAWYDNEWGYACRLAEFAEYIGSKV